MYWGRIAGLSILALGWCGVAVSAHAQAPLADAAEMGDGALILGLLQESADVNAAQVDGMTALHWAVYNDDADMAGLLVRSGADVNAENRYGVPPLSLASTNGNATVVRLLLDAGADPNESLEGGETVLMIAARTGSLEAVERLLAEGADPNAQERREQTALMWAAAEGHAPVVGALIGAGADINATLGSGFTAMFFAVREGHIDVAFALLEAGVDVNRVLQRVREGPRATNNASSQPIARGTSPLLMAVRNGHFELAVELLKAGADPNDQLTGFAPLHTMSWVRKPDASDRGDPAPIGSGSLTSLEFVRALVALGADVNLRLDEEAPRQPNSASRVRSGGATPFLLAADRADATLMRLLLELGADPHVPNLRNTTALMVAAGVGTTAPGEEAGTELEALEATRLMLELGADVDAVNDENDTAMHGAAYGMFPEVVDLLAENGADPHIWKRENDRGWTPLFITEGFRFGLPRHSRPTLEAVERLMLAAGIPTDGPRPSVIDIYEVTPNPPATAQSREWTTLFDGSNLDGWSVLGDANWEVADGAVSANSGGGFLVSDESYGDFELRLEFWVDEPANSGVFIRCAEPQNVNDRNCYEVNIYDTRADQTYRTGGIVHLAAPSTVINAGGQWNTYEITAQGSRLIVVLNGTQTVDTTDDQFGSGPFALQYGAGIVRFRNVQIRSLD